MKQSAGTLASPILNPESPNKTLPTHLSPIYICIPLFRVEGLGGLGFRALLTNSMSTLNPEPCTELQACDHSQLAPWLGPPWSVEHRGVVKVI